MLKGASRLVLLSLLCAVFSYGQGETESNLRRARIAANEASATGALRTLARVIFDGERKHALVYVGNGKDWLSGSGIAFAKDEEGWKVKTSRIVWLS